MLKENTRTTNIFLFLTYLQIYIFMFITEVNKETCPAYYFWIDYRNSYYPFWWCGSLYMYWWGNSCDKLLQGKNTSHCFSLFPLQLVLWHEMCLGLSFGGRSDHVLNRLCVLTPNSNLCPSIIWLLIFNKRWHLTFLYAIAHVLLLQNKTADTILFLFHSFFSLNAIILSTGKVDLVNLSSFK